MILQMSIYIKTWITCLEVQEHFEGISVWGPEEPLFEDAFLREEWVAR